MMAPGIAFGGDHILSIYINLLVDGDGLWKVVASRENLRDDMGICSVQNISTGGDNEEGICAKFLERRMAKFERP